MAGWRYAICGLLLGMAGMATAVAAAAADAAVQDAEPARLALVGSGFFAQGKLALYRQLAADEGVALDYVAAPLGPGPNEGPPVCAKAVAAPPMDRAANSSRLAVSNEKEVRRCLTVMGTELLESWTRTYCTAACRVGPALLPAVA